MPRKKFKLWHSVVGLGLLLALQALFTQLWLVFIAAIVGSLVTLYVATEVIEEVRNARHMLFLLSAVVAQFVIFFAFEYWFLAAVAPDAFPTLPLDGLGYLLHSTMVFVFNPLYLPATVVGRALLLINTLGSLGLVLFILQNIWQIKK